MLHKQKIQLLALIFIPSAIILFATISLLFVRQLLWIIHWSYYLPLIFIILCFCFPISRFRIGGDNVKSRYSFVHWFVIVMGIECLAGLLFYGQYQVILSHAIVSDLSSVTPGSLYSLKSSLFLNHGLFPWSLLTALAVIFVIASYRHSVYWPFSVLLMTEKKRASFFQHAIKIIIAIYLRFAFRFFVAFNVMIAALLLAFLIRPSFHVYQPISGMIIALLLFFLYQRSDSQRILCLVEKQKLSLGVFSIFLIVFMAILLVITDYVVLHWVMPRFHAKNSLLILHFFQHFISVPLAWRLWTWEWWILAIPFFASWLGNVSYGRKIYSFILIVLTLPVILWFAAKLGYLQSISEVYKTFSSSALLILLGLIGQICFLSFLRSHSAISYLWLGFMPIAQLGKTRTTGINQLWLVVIGILVILMMTEIQLLQWLLMLIAIPCMIIFVGNMIAAVVMNILRK